MNALRLVGDSMKRPEGVLLRQLPGHTNFVGSLVAMPDNRTVVSSSEDGTIRVWNLHTGECLHVLTAHKSAVNCIARNAAGTLLVSASDDHDIKVWNTNDWSVARTLKGHTNYVSRVAVTPTDGLISCGRDGTVRIWDLVSGREFACFEWKSWITRIAISPDGFTAVCSSVDNVMKVYDVERAKELRVLVDGSAGFMMIPGFDLFISGNSSGVGHENGPHDIAFTPNGKRLVSVEKELIVWDFETGKELFRRQKNAWAMNTLVMTPAGRVFTAGKTVQIQDADGRVLAEMKGHAGEAKSLALTPDEKFLVSGSGGKDGGICVWDVTAALGHGVPPGHASYVSAAVISPDGTRGLTGSSDGTARMWDLATGAQLHVFRHGSEPFVDQLAFTPDGARAITCAHDGSMRLWDVATGKEAAVLQYEKGSYSFGALAVTADGRFAVAGEVGDDLTLWDLSGASKAPQIGTGKTTHIQSLVFTRDGKRAIATGYVDPEGKDSKGPLQVWDLESGRILQEMRVPGTYYPKLALSADERFAIAGTEKGYVHVWDLQTGKGLREIAAHPGGYLSAVHVLPDGSVATTVAAESDGATHLRIWNLATGEEIRSLATPQGSGRGVTFSKDGSFALLAGSSLAVWDLRTGEILATFTGTSDIFSAAIAPDQRTILAGEVEGRVHVLRLDPR